MQLTSRLLLTGLLLAAPAAGQLSTLEAGYERAGAASFVQYCGGSRSVASFDDGSYIVFDGLDVDHRTAGGVLIQRLGSFPFFSFPSFVEIAPDGLTAYIGESSAGNIYEVDVAGGGMQALATLSFNFSLAFDPTTPGSAYVSASTGGFGSNSVHRIDLASGITEEVIQVTGFSGPVTVNDFGDVILGRLPATFPFPAGATDVLLFDSAMLAGGTVLTGANGLALVTGLNGVSSMEFDLGNEQFFLMETNAGATGFGSELWRFDAAGALQEKVAESTVFAGGIELINSPVGTRFGPYQPSYAGLRFSESDCFGLTPIADRVDVVGSRPSNSFSGPSIGMSGAADFSVTGGVPNGFASLWLARSTNFLVNDTIMNMGGFFPIALRANPNDYVRRFPMVQLDPNGDFTFPFFQDVAIEGAMIAQWIVFDAAMVPVTSSNVQVNRSQF